MSSPRVIALTCYAQSGKSTVAEILERDHGYVRTRFAKPLKDMLRAIGLCEAELEGNLKESPCALLQGQTPRWAMQSLGTEWGREMIGCNFWAGVWEHTACEIVDQGGKIVVEDCRFPNEVTVIRNLFGTVWRIERPGTGSTTHESERHVDTLDWDFRILNTGSVDDLRATVGRLMP